MVSRSAFALCVVAILIVALAPTPLALPAAVDAQGPSTVVLWNRLGSQTEVENSEVGLDGTFHGGGFVDGVFGGAFTADYTQDNLVTFPKEVVPIYEGTIEFWARLHDYPDVLQWGQNPAFVSINSTNPPASWLVHLNGNDGGGNGGLCGGVGYNLLAGTGVFGTWTYERVLGAGQVEAWHHYALAWDEN
ncbi:MAG: hypothetical protein EHM35_17380, partial [Planctomycetaceae bacterium]